LTQSIIVVNICCAIEVILLKPELMIVMEIGVEM